MALLGTNIFGWSAYYGFILLNEAQTMAAFDAIQREFSVVI